MTKAEINKRAARMLTLLRSSPSSQFNNRMRRQLEIARSKGDFTRVAQIVIHGPIKRTYKSMGVI